MNLPKYSRVIANNIETESLVLNIFHALVPGLYTCVDENADDEEKL